MRQNNNDPVTLSIGLLEKFVVLNAGNPLAYSVKGSHPRSRSFHDVLTRILKAFDD